jgi:hypothetical protein
MASARGPLGATRLEGELMLSVEERVLVEEMRQMKRALTQTPSTMVEQSFAAKQMGVKSAALTRSIRKGEISAESWGGKTYILARDVRLGAKRP